MGEAEIATFSTEELLATKLRALLQRNKGRDLIDLAHAKAVFPKLDARKTVELLGRYLAANGRSISRAEAERRMFDKLDNPNFMADVRPLLAADEAASFDDKAARRAFVSVFAGFVGLMPGAPWAQTPNMIEKFKLDGLASYG